MGRRIYASIKLSFAISTFSIIMLSDFVFADWKQFLIPVSFDNGASLEFTGSHEADDSNSIQLNSNWSDFFLKEKLNLHSEGYFYHPAFIQYQAGLGGSLKQENYKTTLFPDVGWQHDTGIEYLGRLFFLPFKPYNLQLFAQRVEPLFRNRSAVQTNNVETSKGALFRYRQRPWFARASAREDVYHYPLYSSNVKILDSQASYYKEFGNGKSLLQSVSFRPSRFSSSSGLTGNSQDFSAANTLTGWKASLDSNISESSSDQDNIGSFPFHTSQLQWFERVGYLFPYNFRTHASYRYQKQSNSTSALEQEAKITSQSREILADVTQRLYDSLESSYNFRHSNLDSNPGNVIATLHSFTSTYSKRIPSGRLIAGVQLGRSVTDTSGSTSVVNEPHNGIQVPGSFVLSQQGVDSQSIRVFLKSPLPPNEIILLEADVNYTITPFSNSFEINLLTLPPQFVVPGTYDFFVSYNLLFGGSKLESNSFGYNASVELLHGLLTPYYRFFKLSSKVLEGNFNGVPVNSTSRTVGLSLFKWSFRAFGEYEDVNSNVSPYHAWRAGAEYTKTLTETFGIRGAANYLNRKYPVGTAPEPGLGYTETRTSVTAGIQKRFPTRRLTTNASGTYAHDTGLVLANSYSFDANLQWNVGKVALSVGGSAFHSDTESGFDVFRRTHHYIYFNLIRELF